MLQYDVLKGPVTDHLGKEFKDGDVMEFPEGDPLAVVLVQNGIISPKGFAGGIPTASPAKDAQNTTSNLNENTPDPKEGAASATATGATLDTTENPEAAAAEEQKASPTEPRLRYRGQLVLEETDRTVGAQTFKHIRLGDGSELDMTDREYNAEVHLSYPPTK